jgi:hypothetical protein
MNRRRTRQASALQRLADATGIQLGTHAIQRALEFGHSLDAVYRCLARPEQTYGCPRAHGPDRRMYQRGEISVVVHEPTRFAVTVLPRTPNRWEHGVDTPQSIFLARRASEIANAFRTREVNAAF